MKCTVLVAFVAAVSSVGAIAEPLDPCSLLAGTDRIDSACRQISRGPTGTSPAVCRPASTKRRIVQSQPGRHRSFCRQARKIAYSNSVQCSPRHLPRIRRRSWKRAANTTQGT